MIMQKEHVLFDSACDKIQIISPQGAKNCVYSF